VIVNQEDIIQLIKKDKLFQNILSQYGVPPNWQRPTGFISLSKIILEQQVSLASANAHFQKLNLYIKEFTPENIIKLSDDEMRLCQISKQKSKYLKELSLAIIENRLNLNELTIQSEKDIKEKLTAIKGIGNWTSAIYLLFCLQKKDIFPLGDIAVINTIKELTPAKTPTEIEQIAEKWKPLRSLAVYFLWHHYLTKRNRTAQIS
jgi:DNA-3-methyladenine glycosylase II